MVYGDKEMETLGVRVLSSAEYIVSRSTEIKIVEDNVAIFAVKLATLAGAGDMGPDRWQSHFLHPKTKDQEAVDW